MHLSVLLVLGVLLSWAVWQDLCWRTIPNWLVAGGSLLGMLIGAGQGYTGLGDAAAGWAVGMALLLPFYAAGGMSAGDVKLMGMAGSFLGWQAALTAVLCTGLAGGVLALLWWMRTAGAEPASPASPSAPASSAGDAGRKQRAQLPYALAVAAGTGMSVVMQRLL